MKKLWHFALYLLAFTILFAGVLGASFLLVNYNLKYEMPTISLIELYDNENELFLSYCYNKKQSYVPLNDISTNTIDAFISIEDKRFYEHRGLDFMRIGGAIIANLKSGTVREGASTITQQYVKNIFLSSEKTITRKLYEALIAINFEGKYTKDEILEGYLNTIYFDHGIYGIEDASLFYFNKPASDLTLVESVCLASIPKSPVYYSPIKNPENNQTRRNLILLEMLSDGKISADAYANALVEELEIVGIKANNLSANAPYFQDYVISELQKWTWLDEYRHLGLKVETTLDAKLNEILNAVIAKRLPNNDLEIAIYAVDPSTGHVLAIIGGRDYESSTYNRAIASLRQPGSAIKPFVYLGALEHGFTQSTTFKSEETTFYLNGDTYTPHNYGEIYANDDVSMVYALATSDNIYAVKTHLFLGPEVLVSTLQKCGFSHEIPEVASLALGTCEVSLQELTEGYSILANNGLKADASLIKRITTFDGTVLYEQQDTSAKKIASSTDTYLLSEAMTAMFNSNITYNIRPTGAIISSLISHKVAAKSGTTDTDNWIVGYTPEIVLGVWTGYDNNQAITTLTDMRCGKYIWAEAIDQYLDYTGSSWYTTPSDVVSVNLNPMSGFYPMFGAYNMPFYFKKSNLPWFVRLLYR